MNEETRSRTRKLKEEGQEITFFSIPWKNTPRQNIQHSLIKPRSQSERRPEKAPILDSYNKPITGDLRDGFRQESSLYKSNNSLNVTWVIVI